MTWQVMNHATVALAPVQGLSYPVAAWVLESPGGASTSRMVGERSAGLAREVGEGSVA